MSHELVYVTLIYVLCNIILYMSKYTTIRLKKETHDLLLTQGTVADSFDSVIRKLVLKNKEKEKETYKI